MLRQIREHATQGWIQVWKNHPQQGRYAQANRLPPSLRPSSHFEELRDKRELFGRLTQCRTGHGYLGDFYMKVDATSNPTCPCGEPYQTRTHILRNCHLYRDYRYILEEISPTIYPPDILGTHKGIKALTEFLLKSNAFTRSVTGPPTRHKPTIDNRLPEDHFNEELEDGHPTATHNSAQ